MVHSGGALVLVQLCLVVYCTLDVIRTPDEQVRNLPKLVWLALVLLVPIVGAVVWLAAGRPQGPARSRPAEDRGIRSGRDRPLPTAALPPDDDEAFLRRLRERAEQQRRAERERRAADPDA